jgi:inorganic pyrophosphatase
MDTIGGTDPVRLPVHTDGLVVAVIETPSGSGNKLKFDPDLGIFRLERVLPAGMTFSFDFGFIPQTLADDGDPIDVIVLLDSPLYPGCAVKARMIGVLLAEQQDGGDGPWIRNDRLVAVAGGSKGHSSLRTIRDVDPFRLEAIESFFTTYHGLDGDRFRVTGRGGPKVAANAINRAHAAFTARSKDSAA